MLITDVSVWEGDSLRDTHSTQWEASRTYHFSISFNLHPHMYASHLTYIHMCHTYHLSITSKVHPYSLSIRCVAVCCSVLQNIEGTSLFLVHKVCCSVLQCVAVCCRTSKVHPYSLSSFLVRSYPHVTRDAHVRCDAHSKVWISLSSIGWGIPKPLAKITLSVTPSLFHTSRLRGGYSQ